MIITFASSKGGVGKSTSCVALAGAYAKAGQRVHIIDLDGNKTASRWLADDSLAPANVTVSAPDPQLLTEHLQETARLFAPDMILIDIAGAYEQALTIAIARAHLTIIPASTTEADIFEAARVARHIQTIFAAFGKTPLYRVLATRVAPLVTHAQAHGFKQIARLKLPLLKPSSPPAPPTRRSAFRACPRITPIPAARPPPRPSPSSTSSGPRSTRCSSNLRRPAARRPQPSLEVAS